jgi:hypothetical protein
VVIGFFGGRLKGLADLKVSIEAMVAADDKVAASFVYEGMFGNQDQRLDRRAPCQCVVLALRQLRDVVGGIAQGDQLTAIGQRDRIIKGVVPACVSKRESSVRNQDDLVGSAHLREFTRLAACLLKIDRLAGYERTSPSTNAMSEKCHQRTTALLLVISSLSIYRTE